MEIAVNGIYDLKGKSLTIENMTLSIASNSKVINGKILLKESGRIISNSDEMSNVQVEVRGKNVIIDGFKWESNGISLYSNYNCSNLKVKNCKIISKNNNSIKIVADKISNVNKNIIIDNSDIVFYRMGIELQNHGNTDYKFDGVLILDCRIKTIEDSTDYRYGISLTGYGKNVKINDCFFNSCVKGIEVVGFSNLEISDCNFINGGSNSIITSNTRHMSNLHIKNNLLEGLYIYNVENSIIEDNVINCKQGKYVEIKNSFKVTFRKNKIQAVAHYNILLNNAYNNLVEENEFIQNSTSVWAIVRCYGTKCTGNVIKSNKFTKDKKSKEFDNYNGAANNTYSK